MKRPVDTNASFYRDETNNAIINSNMVEYNNYLQVKNLKNIESKRIDNIENNLDNLKNEMTEIKNLMKEILNGIK
jgi:hypothetical protein